MYWLYVQKYQGTCKKTHCSISSHAPQLQVELAQETDTSKVKIEEPDDDEAMNNKQYQLRMYKSILGPVADQACHMFQVMVLASEYIFGPKVNQMHIAYDVLEMASLLAGTPDQHNISEPMQKTVSPLDIPLFTYSI